MSSNPRILIGALALSAAGLVGVTQYEGYTGTAVQPLPGDVPTIGFGTTAGVRMGDKITPPVALARALTDISKFEGAIKQCVRVPLHQYEYDAYVSLAYNIGAARFCDSTLVRELNAGNYESACAHIEDFNKFQGHVQPGLQRRRAGERAKCEGRQ